MTHEQHEAAGYRQDTGQGSVPGKAEFRGVATVVGLLVLGVILMDIGILA